MHSLNAETVSKALGGKRVGGSWMARCPAHDDRTPSLSIDESREGLLLVYCHAGCSQEAVIAALRELRLWDGGPLGIEQHRASANAPACSQNHSKDNDRITLALKLWCEGKPAQGTVVETYLNTRGLTLQVPSCIKFHPRLWHQSGKLFPAMLCLIRAGREYRPLGIHRTFLNPDGLAKAPVDPSKMILGQCKGGAVRLGPPSKPLMIGEGIETCLAAMLAMELSSWAALSTSGLRSLELPDEVRDVILLADGDEPGEAAAVAAADRFYRQGRRVRVARAPAGSDFNDLLLA